MGLKVFIPRVKHKYVLVLFLVLVFGLGLELSYMSEEGLGNEYSFQDNRPLITEQAENPNQYKVVRVVDGDTIVVSRGDGDTTVRMIGINTPETVDPRKTVECFGIEASNKMKLLLEEGIVVLEPDPEVGDVDKYGRSLRYVHLLNGMDVNKIMLMEGFAYENGYGKPYSRQLDYKLAQEYASKYSLGLWNKNTCSGKP